MKMAHLKLIKKQEPNSDEKQLQDEKDQTEELTPEKKPKVFKLKKKQDRLKGVKNRFKGLKRRLKRKRIKVQKWYAHKKTNRNNKKEFRAQMQNEGKRDRMLRKTTDILPFVQIHDDHILLRDGVMDILQVETKNISSLNDADIEFLL